MHFLKKVKIFCELLKKSDSLDEEMRGLGQKLNRLHNGLMKNSDTIKSLVKYNLEEVYAIMEKTINYLYKALLLSKESTSTEWGELTENLKKIRTAQKLIGEVIGEGGVDK